MPSKEAAVASPDAISFPGARTATDAPFNTDAPSNADARSNANATAPTDPAAATTDRDASLRRAYIGLGANQGNAVDNLRAAIAAIRDIERTTIVDISPFYRSAPVDAEGPDFLNAVLSVDTDLDPYALLLYLTEIELMLGRKRSSTAAAATKVRKEARQIDLDLLLVESLIIRSAPLVLPHPRMHLRAFVLAPLRDIAPSVQIPGYGLAARLLARLEPQEIERLPEVGSDSGPDGTAAGDLARGTDAERSAIGPAIGNDNGNGNGTP